MNKDDFIPMPHALAEEIIKRATENMSAKDYTNPKRNYLYEMHNMLEKQKTINKVKAYILDFMFEITAVYGEEIVIRALNEIAEEYGKEDENKEKK